MKARAIFLVNYDWFFVSHRLALGLALKEAGFDVGVAALATGAHQTILGAGLKFWPMPFEPGGRNPAQEARTLAAIGDLYRRERPDLVHQVTIKPVLYGSLTARALRVPAVVNAIIDGLYREYGIDHIDMPATAERVWMAIENSRRQHRM